MYEPSPSDRTDLKFGQVRPPEVSDAFSDVVLRYIKLTQDSRCKLQAGLQRFRDHSGGPRLFQLQPIVNVVGPHKGLDVREVLVKGPHASVVGPCE